MTRPIAHISPPRLFGRRMRTRMRVHGVTGWVLRFGGVSAVISHDAHLSDRPWHWQLDAWTRYGVISGRARTERAAVGAVERLLARVGKAVSL